MLARVSSGALRGIDAILVAVEVDVSSGLPHTTTVGLPDGAVREASDRIRAALRNAGLEYPTKRVTVNVVFGSASWTFTVTCAWKISPRSRAVGETLTWPAP